MLRAGVDMRWWAVLLQVACLAACEAEETDGVARVTPEPTTTYATTRTTECPSGGSVEIDYDACLDAGGIYVDNVPVGAVVLVEECDVGATTCRPSTSWQRIGETIQIASECVSKTDIRRVTWVTPSP